MTLILHAPNGAPIIRCCSRDTVGLRRLLACLTRRRTGSRKRGPPGNLPPAVVTPAFLASTTEGIACWWGRALRAHRKLPLSEGAPTEQSNPLTWDILTKPPRSERSAA